MSVSLCRTPLLRILSVGVAVLCITQTPALADDPPPPGAQHFDFAAAWSRPAVPFTSFSALLRKDHDENIPDELQCNEFQCGTWIGDEHSPEDEFDLIGTLTFIDVVPFPHYIKNLSADLSEADPELVGHAIEGEVVIERFLFIAHLETPTDYSKAVFGYGFKATMSMTAPEVVMSTSTAVRIFYEWNDLTDAVDHLNSLVASWNYGLFDFQISASASEYSLPAGQSSQQGNQNQQTIGHGPAYCSHKFEQDVAACSLQYKTRVNGYTDDFRTETEAALAKFEFDMDNWDTWNSLQGGYSAAMSASGLTCAIIPGVVGFLCAGPIGGAALGAAVLADVFVIGAIVSEADYYKAVHDTFNRTIAVEKSRLASRWCAALRDVRSCLETALEDARDCLGEPTLVPWTVPLDQLIPDIIPNEDVAELLQNCTHTSPIHLDPTFIPPSQRR